MQLAQHGSSDALPLLSAGVGGYILYLRRCPGGWSESPKFGSQIFGFHREEFDAYDEDRSGYIDVKVSSCRLS